MVTSPAAARQLALDALIHLSGNIEETEAFLASTGLRPDDLRLVAEDPETALHVLDFILETDERVISAAQALAVTPQQLLSARTTLSGPGSYGWEPD